MRRAIMTAVLLLAAVLVAGCGIIPGWSSDAPATAASTSPPGASWLIVAQGTPTVSPSPPAGSSPSASASTGFLPLASATPTTAFPTPTCVGTAQTGQLSGLTAVPSATSAVVSWYNRGGPSLISYRLTAIPQRLVAGAQPDLTWQTIKPGAACRVMNATVTGLDRRAPYVFSLDAVVAMPGSDGTRAATVARSQVVYTS